MNKTEHIQTQRPELVSVHTVSYIKALLASLCMLPGNEWFGVCLSSDNVPMAAVFPDNYQDKILLREMTFKKSFIHVLDIESKRNLIYCICLSFFSFMQVWKYVFLIGS